ncbi:MAG TPA: peptidoglycan-associated lipoprotein Pal [Gemmatimonadota bacterium]|nr:peptidoglycan-associated lipoprotein Pal [Gemmatimonadota bacterium]
MFGRTLMPLVTAALLFTLVATGCARRQSPQTDTTRDRTDTPVATDPGEGMGAEDPAMMGRETAMAEVGEMIFFDFDRSELKPEARETLQRKSEALRQFPEINVRIEGHADERGTIEYNLALGERRAEAARQYLIDLGIDADRLTTISYGEERPLVPESNEAAWAQNRRDEFIPIGM